MDKKKLRMEALARVGNGEYFDELRKNAAARSKKVLDKYKDINPTEENMRVTNEAYEDTHKGMTPEEKEISAEQEYNRKRKEMGLR